MTSVHARFTIIILLLLFLGRSVFSQVQIGFTAGFGLSTINFKEESSSGLAGSSSDYASKTGFSWPIISGHAGIVYEVPLSRDFSIRGKVQIASKGWGTLTTEQHDFYSGQPGPTTLISKIIYYENFRIEYVDAPVQFIFYFPLKKTKLFLGVGPYVGYGLIGKYKRRATERYRSTVKEANTSLSFEKSATAFEINRINYGMLVSAGIQFRNRMTVDATFDGGFNKVSLDRYYNFPNKYQVVSVNYCYFLKRKQNGKNKAYHD